MGLAPPPTHTHTESSITSCTGWRILFQVSFVVLSSVTPHVLLAAHRLISGPCTEKLTIFTPTRTSVTDATSSIWFACSVSKSGVDQHLWRSTCIGRARNFPWKFFSHDHSSCKATTLSSVTELSCSLLQRNCRSPKMRLETRLFTINKALSEHIRIKPTVSLQADG